MRKTPLPPRTKPLGRRQALRRSGIVQAVALARSAVPQRRRTPPGEFSARVRLLLWLRWQGLCVVCGRPLPRRGWTAQHRRARGAGGSTDPVTVSVANGLAVHELPCHRRIEDQPVWALSMGYRVPQHGDPAGTAVVTWQGLKVRLTSTGTCVPAQAEET